MNNNSGIQKWHSHGAMLFNSENYAEALQCYDKILSNYPKDFLAVFGKGKVFLKLKEYDKALACFNTVLNMNPGYIPAIKNKQLIEEKKKEIETEEFVKWSKIGVEYYSSGEYEKALECFENAFRINPYSKTLQTNLEKTNEKLTEIIPVRWNNKGVEYYKIGQYKKARVCFEKALRLNPKLESAMKNLKMVENLIQKAEQK